jgi:hypothetical protein
MARLTAPDLLTPRGRLNAASLYPNTDGAALAAHLGEYLAQGYAALAAAGVDVDTAPDAGDAARAYAYWRAYGEVYEAMVARPSSFSLNNEGSGSWLLTQMDYMRTLRDEARADYDARVLVLTGSDTGAGDAGKDVRTTTAVPNRFTSW